MRNWHVQFLRDVWTRTLNLTGQGQNSIGFLGPLQPLAFLL